jgi:hypothetical protein
MTLGYIIPLPQNYNAPNPEYLTLTATGKEWTQSSSPIPEDSDGFMAALIALIPKVDRMVGAANEKLIYMLLDALLLVTGGKEGKAIEKAIKDRNLPNMFDQINKALTLHIDSGFLPYQVHEGCQLHLLSLSEAIRVQRNEAVHPVVGQVTPTTVRLTLSAFPSACRKVYDLVEWCHHGISTP